MIHIMIIKRTLLNMHNIFYSVLFIIICPTKKDFKIKQIKQVLFVT